MKNTITLTVRTLDRAPMHGTGGGLVPITECDHKGVAAKLLEEAAESYGAWQVFDEDDKETHCGNRSCTTCEYREGCWTYNHPDAVQREKEAFADELADVITAACDLAKVCGLDLQAALDRNERRQVEGGRIDG